MQGAITKTFYAQKEGLDPKKMFVVSVMPCTAKKFEIKREGMGRDGYRDVDASLTTIDVLNDICGGGVVCIFKGMRSVR